MQYAFNKSEAIEGEDYAISSNSFDPSVLSSSNVERDWEEWDFNNYACSFLVNYASDEDMSSDFGNVYEELVRDWNWK
jgi:hypothetical protein